MSFAQNLKYIKEKKNLTNYRLAKIFGCSQSSLINWLDNGVVPHPKTRQKIADHFGITLAELDGDELPVLPPQGAKKAPAAECEGLSAAKKALLVAIDDLSDAQCEKLLPIVLSAKQVL
jgi:transcriptional regulator with XRE-family HTH domain